MLIKSITALAERMMNGGEQREVISQGVSEHPVEDAPPPYFRLESENIKSPAQGMQFDKWPYDWQTQKFNIGFTFASNPKRESSSDLAWEAEMPVHARDIPQVMSHGFHWDARNVKEEKGYLTGKESLPPDLREAGWEWVRYFFLEDLAEDPEWTATLCVCAHKMSVLSVFRIGELRLDQVVRAAAVDSEMHLVYSFNVADPTANVNTYYDDKPLSGWWPWPKEDASGKK